MKRCGHFLITCALVLQGGVVSGFSMASRLASAPALLLVPAQFAPLQVGFDVAERYSTVLVAYQTQGVGREPVLHVWDGAQWVRIGMQDIRTFSFLSVAPERVLLVGDENTLPSALVDATAGTAGQYVLPSTDAASMVNHFGHFYNFRSQDWRWFADRYNLDLADMNQARREESWYNQSSEKVPAFDWRRNRQLRRATAQRRREVSRAPAPIVQAPVMPPERTIPDVLPLYETPVAPTPALSVRERPTVSTPAPSPAEVAVPAIPEDWEERAVATEAPPVK